MPIQKFAAILALAGAGGFAFCLPIGAAQAAQLTVAVENVQPGQGRVMVGLFDEAGFPKTVRYGAQASAPSRGGQGTVQVTFPQVPPGRYAISAYQDRDGSGMPTTNVMGLPTEAYGFSNGATGSFGPPAFASAAVELPVPQGSTITVRIK
jgi:uncharacterized protein (DUF2141 family)